MRLLGGLFALLSSPSFVFIELFGTGRAVFGALLAELLGVLHRGHAGVPPAAGARSNAARAVASAACLSLAGGALLAAVAFFGPPTVAAVMPACARTAPGTASTNPAPPPA